MFAAPHGSVVFALSSRNYHSEFEHEKGVEKGITFTFSYFPYKRPIDQQPIRLSVDRWIDGCCSVGCSDCSAPTTIHQCADPSPSARTAGCFHSFFLYLPQLNLFNSMGFFRANAYRTCIGGRSSPSSSSVLLWLFCSWLAFLSSLAWIASCKTHLHNRPQKPLKSQ